VAEIVGGADNNPVLVYEDTRQQIVRREEFDLVVLATACAPADGMAELAEFSASRSTVRLFCKTSPENPSIPPGGHLCLRLRPQSHGHSGIGGPGEQRRFPGGTDGNRDSRKITQGILKRFLRT
jgi:hypothetical protein